MIYVCLLTLYQFIITAEKLQCSRLRHRVALIKIAIHRSIAYVIKLN